MTPVKRLEFVQNRRESMGIEWLREVDVEARVERPALVCCLGVAGQRDQDDTRAPGRRWISFATS